MSLITTTLNREKGKTMARSTEVVLATQVGNIAAQLAQTQSQFETLADGTEELLKMILTLPPETRELFANITLYQNYLAVQKK